jgi:transposase
VIAEAHGIPLAASLTGGHRNDVTQLMPLIEAIPPVRGRRGRPRQRPGRLYADRGYDHDKYRTQIRAKGITPVIARRSTGHGSGLGAHRWVIEQSIALLHWFRRLRIRWEIRDDIHEALLSLACAIICWRRLRNLTLLGPRTLSGPSPICAQPGLLHLPPAASPICRSAFPVVVPEQPAHVRWPAAGLRCAPWQTS